MAKVVIKRFCPFATIFAFLLFFFFFKNIWGLTDMGA